MIWNKNNEYRKYNKLTDYEKEQFPIFFDIANSIGILQISYLSTLVETSEEDKFWYDESEKGLAFGDFDLENMFLTKISEFN